MVVRKPSSDNKIVLGMQGENLACTVQIPISTFIRNYGNGTFSATYARPGEDDAAYPVTITSDNNYVYWKPAAVDTAISGKAKLELDYTVNSVVAKSVIYNCYIEQSVILSDETPALLEPWTTTLKTTLDYADAVLDKHPYIDEDTNTWFVFDTDTMEYVDTEISSIGPKGEDYVHSEEFERLSQQAINQANAAKNECLTAVTHYPKIGTSGKWEVWSNGAWVETDIAAHGDTGSSGVAISTTMPTDPTVNVWIKTNEDPDDPTGAAVYDVFVDNQSCVSYGYARMPYATKTRGGIVRVDPDNGIRIDNTGCIHLVAADEEAIESASSDACAITPNNLKFSVKNALTDVVDDQWTDDEKYRAKSKLGINNSKKIMKIDWDANNYANRYIVDCEHDMRHYFVSVSSLSYPMRAVQSSFGFKFDDDTIITCPRYLTSENYKGIIEVSIVGDFIRLITTKFGDMQTVDSCTYYCEGIQNKTVEGIVMDVSYGNYLATGSVIMFYEG